MCLSNGILVLVHSVKKTSQVINTMQTVPKTFNIRSPQKPCLVFVYADWCSHCKVMKPIMQKVAQILGSVVPVYAVNSDEYPQYMKAWSVKGFPTILFADAGEVYTYEGDRSADAISSFVCHSFSSSKKPDVCTRFM